MMSQPLPRRTFLRGCLLTGAGVCVGSVVSGLRLPQAPAGFAENDSHPHAPHPTFEQRVKDLKLELPPASKPVATYVPAVISGNLLYTAGHIPWLGDGKPLPGRVGADLTLEQGAAAARSVGLSILTTVRQTLGTLDRVVRLVKVLGMVNCTPDFTQQPKVINGFSELMVQIFGDVSGKGARSAIGVSALPFNVPVEIEAIFEVRR